jgi:hypothetical protein
VTTGRLVQLTAVSVPVGTSGRLVELTASVATPSGTTGRLVRLVASVPPRLEISSPAQTGKVPYSTVTVSASATGGTVTTWTFSSPGITFSGSGASRTFTAPATRHGTVVPITIGAVGSGVDPGEIVTTVAVLPHGEFKKVSGVETPVRWTRRT